MAASQSLIPVAVQFVKLDNIGGMLRGNKEVLSLPSNPGSVKNLADFLVKALTGMVRGKRSERHNIDALGYLGHAFKVNEMRAIWSNNGWDGSQNNFTIVSEANVGPTMMKLARFAEASLEVRIEEVYSNSEGSGIPREKPVATENGVEANGAYNY